MASRTNLVLFIALLPAVTTAAAKPNILFIAVDDMNNWAGCLSGHPDVQTPAIDRLARRGVLFTNCHCTSPICGPSRAAVLTGRRCESTGVYTNKGRYKNYVPDAMAFPRFFRTHGYFTAGAGKINHGLGEHEPENWDTYGPDCGIVGTPFTDAELRTEGMLPERIINRMRCVLPMNGGISFIDRPTNTWDTFDWGPLDLADRDFPDGKVADWAIGQLGRTHRKPFLLAVGIYKPHQPFFLPRAYFERYDRDRVKLPPTIPGDLDDVPQAGRDLALRPWTSGTHKTVTGHGKWREAVHAYLAAITFADAQVGKVIEQLDAGAHAENTWIVLWSDHGWALGQKEHWGKHAPWSPSLKVPLIIVPPRKGSPAGFKPGTRCDAPVSLLDLYPTLLAMSGLPRRKELEGQNLLPLVRNPAHPWRKAVVATIGRGTHSVFTKQWRYIRYYDGSEELYNLRKDRNEWTNLAGKSRYAAVKNELAAHIPEDARFTRFVRWGRWKCVFQRGETAPLLFDMHATFGIAEQKDVAAENPATIRAIRRYLEDNRITERRVIMPAATTVFERGADAYPAYRIPALVTTNRGTLLAFAEGRQTLSDHARNDIVLKRSTDGGRTWGPLITVHQDPNGVLVNPCAVVLDSGRTLLMYQRFPVGYHARAMGKKIKLLDPGISGKTISTTLVTTSDDDGATWSPPRDVTAGTKRPTRINSTATGPGCGIVLRGGPHAGRIVMPTNEGWWEGRQRFFKVYACLSDDGGATWRLGTPAPAGDPGMGNEVQMVERDDGSILLNSRSYRGSGHRKSAISRDGGESWSPLVDEKALPEPGCMGTVLRIQRDKGEPTCILYAGPGARKGRTQGTICVSMDGGETWPKRKVVYPGGYAYSCLTRLKDGSIGLLFEADGYRRIAFARYTLDELLAHETEDAGTSFEGIPAGPLTELKTGVGVWRAAPGHATVSRRTARTGTQSLRLLGGNERSVELIPAQGRSHQLTFWAERWTRRNPFRFRVDRYARNAWHTIYTGDRVIRIGGFHCRVSIDLAEAPAERYRLICTSPAESGILIDDVAFVPSRPMEILGVTTTQPTIPVLTGRSNSRVLGIGVTTAGNKNPIEVRELVISTDGTTDLKDIVSVAVHGGDRPFGAPQSPAARLTFTGRQPLEHGENTFWVTYTLAPTADIDNHVDAGCESIRFDGRSGTIVPETKSPTGTLRLGVALRQTGDSGSRGYRIPGLVRTERGTLIAVYDIRWRGGGDLPGDVDIGMSRSSDGGRTWEPMKKIMDMGRDPKWRYDGIGDPSVLVDRTTNTIWVAATWSHGNRSWVGSGPGLTPEQTGQFMLVKSEDDGRTWSEPINITRQIKKPAWCFVLQGPGRGITMRDGTIVFPAQYQDPPNRRRLPHSTIIYSRDHGRSWKIGTGAYDDTTEAAVAEIEPGVLMLNCRYNRQNRRVVMVTRNMGSTWTEHSTSRKALPEPSACMASLITLDRHGAGPPWLLFSNPNVDRPPRRRITIKLSKDLGTTWPEATQLLLDAGKGAGYSCLTRIDPHTVGILYEGSQALLTFQRIRLDDVAAGH